MGWCEKLLFCRVAVGWSYLEGWIGSARDALGWVGCCQDIYFIVCMIVLPNLYRGFLLLRNMYKDEDSFLVVSSAKKGESKKIYNTRTK
jgi:hypothetical protein